MAWTITEAVDAWKMKSQAGDELIEVKLSCISDANASDYDILQDLKGTSLYLVKIVPGAGGDAPAGTFDLDIEDETDAHILDTDANSNSATTFHSGLATLGLYPPIKNKVSLVCATLGDANTATIYLYFVR